jgi:hypothetical protein
VAKKKLLVRTNLKEVMKNAKFCVHFEPVRKFKFKRGYENTKFGVHFEPVRKLQEKIPEKSSDN